jgi:hypothetical protein
VPNDTLRERVETRLKALRDERSPWLARWRDVRDLVAPYRGRFLDGSGANDRNAKDQGWKIINNSPGQALRVLAAGMASGLTNPATAWFRLATQDPGLMDSTAVRLWLEAAEQALYRVFARSNCYQQLNVLYFQQAAFGQCPLWHDEDHETVARFQALNIGEYFLANDSRGKATTCYREFKMSVDNVVETFVAGPNRSMNWDAVSTAVKNLYDNGGSEQKLTVCQGFEPMSPRLAEATAGAARGAGMIRGLRRWAYASVYWEKSSDKLDQVLRAGGYDTCAVHAPRWDVELPDAYGIGPCIEAIGDMRQLQVGELRLAQIIDRVSGKGPLTGPPLAGGLSDLGGETYVPIAVGGSASGVRPLYEIPPAAVQLVREELMRVERRIDTTLYKDLFLMLAEIERSGVTATEINEKKEEKLVALGPVVMRDSEELLDPLIDRTFSQLLRFSQPRWRANQAAPLPPPPRELAAQELRVEYVSMLQQAQQARRADGLGRLVQTALALAPVFPDVVDKLNTDEVLDEAAQSWGVSPRALHGADEVATIRQAKQQAAQAAQQQQQMMAGVEGAAKLGGAKMDGTALGALLGQGAQAPGGAPQQGAPAAANAA